MNVLLLGSSGLIGNLTLKYLLQDKRVEKLIIISRRKVEYKISSEFINSENRIINIVGDLLNITIDDFKKYNIDHIDICLCALGTTIKKAQSQQEFRKVDFDMVVSMAKLSKKMGAFHFSVISAQGASKTSPFFYSRVKAEMEEEIFKIGFNEVTILRPGLLIGKREDRRPFERAMIKLSPILNVLLIGKLKNYRGINAEIVAKNLANSGFNKKLGNNIIENIDLLNGNQKHV